MALFADGSVGRGTADASSDLDLVVALVDQAAVQDVCAGWETFIEKITPTVYRRLLGTQIVRRHTVVGATRHHLHARRSDGAAHFGTGDGVVRPRPDSATRLTSRACRVG